mmetsp:Transcript_41570/g.124294  ORF Transcript_41570/g.124294 Transcript_41570/m.124294 type:complete len:326 (-) Transcript_41570:2067-3044(-)
MSTAMQPAPCSRRRAAGAGIAGRTAALRQAFSDAPGGRRWRPHWELLLADVQLRHLGAVEVQQPQRADEALGQLKRRRTLQHKAEVDGEALGRATHHAGGVRCGRVSADVDVALDVGVGDGVHDRQRLADDDGLGADGGANEERAVRDARDELEHLGALSVAAVDKPVQHQVKRLPALVVLQRVRWRRAQQSRMLVHHKREHQVEQRVAWDDEVDDDRKRRAALPHGRQEARHVLDLAVRKLEEVDRRKCERAQAGVDLAPVLEVGPPANVKHRGGAGRVQLRPERRRQRRHLAQTVKVDLRPLLHRVLQMHARHAARRRAATRR